MSAFDDVRDDINEDIVTNGTQGITALVLNPILLAIIQACETTLGDLDDLPTDDKTSLVAAIGELWSLYESISGGTAEEDFLGVFESYDALVAAHPTGNDGEFALVLENGSDNEGIFEFEWDTGSSEWVEVTGVSNTTLTMLISSDGFNGLAALKMAFGEQDFDVTGTPNGGIEIQVDSKFKTAEASDGIITPNTETLYLDKTAGRYYGQIVPLTQDTFEFDQEVLGGKAKALIRTQSGGDGFPEVAHANDIAGRSGVFEPDSLYMLNLECVYIDEIDPANNVVIYWFDKMERATWLPMFFAMGDEETDAVDAQTVKFTMGVKYRLREARLTFHQDDFPEGSDCDFDLEVDGLTVYSTAPQVEDGDHDSRDSSVEPVFSGGKGFVVIPDGAEVELKLGSVGATNAGTGAKMWLYGWALEDIIDASSVEPQES